MKKAAIIIPTTGAPVVRQAIESCLASTYPEIQVIAVVDGKQYERDFSRQTAGLQDTRLLCVTLAENVGGDGYYGHRIYGGFSFLANADFMLFLDEDNFFQPDHVALMIREIEVNNLLWSYALRRICDQKGQFIVNDDCDSLGRWPSWEGYPLIDTNCYCLTREAAIFVAPLWYGKRGQDRVVTSTMIQHLPRFSCTGAYTVNYRLQEERQRRYIEEGNARMRALYPDDFPWARKL